MPEIYSWSRVKLGPNRVYWVVVKWEGWQTIAEGYATTIGAAEDAARAAAGSDALRSTVNLARERHAAKVQSTKVARHNDAEPIKCIYTWDYSDYDSSRIVSEWQVVRETANRYYVRKPWQSASGRTFIVDRATLEREGRVWCRSVGQFFFRDRQDCEEKSWDGQRPAQGDLDLLEVSWPVSEVELKAAFRRRCLVVHPDHGGTDDGFRRLREAMTRVTQVRTNPNFTA